MQKLYFISTARIPTQRAHGLQIMKMCEAFADQGLEVELVISSRYNELEADPFEYYKTKRNFRIKKIFGLDLAPRREPAHPLFYWIHSWTFAFSAIWYLCKKKDGLIYFRYDPPLLALLQLFFRGRNLVCEAHMLLHGRARKLFLRCFAAIVALKAAKAIYDKELGFDDKVFVAPDGVALEDYENLGSKAEIRKELGLPMDARLILYTGYFYKWKGTDALIESARYLESKARLILVGGSPDDVVALERVIRGKGISNITLVGHRPYGEMAKYQKAADCLVVTTAKERGNGFFTSPLKLFEYMASGTPIVASDSVSMREVLTDGVNALLVKPEDPRALAEGFNRIFANRDLARSLALRALKDVRAYAWENRARHILNFLDFRIAAPRVMFLFAGRRNELIAAYKAGLAPDSQLLGINHLAKHNIRPDFFESPFMNVLRKIHFNFAQLAALTKIGSYDILFLGSNLPFVFLLRKILRMKRPAIVLYNTFFTNTLKRHPRGLYRRVIAFAIGAADAIICLSSSQRDFLISQGYNKTKLHFIPTGIDTGFFESAFQNQQCGGEANFGLSVGKDMGRDYATLVEAARALGHKIVVVAAKRNVSENDRLSENVELRFDLPPRELIPLYRDASFVVIPTFKEERLYGSDCSGQYALLDAMAAGKAIIISERSTLFDYVTDGEDALIVKAEDPVSLRNAMQYLIDRPEAALRMGKKARERVLGSCSTKSFASSLARVFKDVYSLRGIGYQCGICGSRSNRVFHELTDNAYLKCRNCGAVFLRDIPNQSVLKRRYNEEYYRPGYAGRGEASFPDFSYRMRTINRFVSPSAKILEVGAASGEFLKILHHQGFSVAGVEPSAPAVLAAKKNYNFDIYKGSLFEAGFPDGSFDCVLFYHVIEHLPDPRAILADAYRILKPGGIVVVELPYPDGFDSFVSRELLESILDYPNHLYLFPKKTIRGVLRKSGFDSIFEETSPSFFVSRFIRSFGPKSLGLSARLNGAKTAFGSPSVALENPVRRFIVSIMSRLLPGMKFTIVVRKITYEK